MSVFDNIVVVVVVVFQLIINGVFGPPMSVIVASARMHVCVCVFARKFLIALANSGGKRAANAIVTKPNDALAIAVAICRVFTNKQTHLCTHTHTRKLTLSPPCSQLIESTVKISVIIVRAAVIPCASHLWIDYDCIRRKTVA